MLDHLRACFVSGRVLYTRHARDEMRSEGFGPVREQEVFEAIQAGRIIEDYPEAEPYPCVLIYGQTATERPIHAVCAYAEDDDLAIVVTVYEPDPSRWADFERRRRCKSCNVRNYSWFNSKYFLRPTIYLHIWLGSYWSCICNDVINGYILTNFDLLVVF